MDGGGHDGGHHGGHHHGGLGHHHSHHDHSEDSGYGILGRSHHHGGQWPSKRGWLVVAVLVMLAFALVVLA